MAHTVVKSAWQNEAGMYAVKTMFSSEEPKLVSEEQLAKLIDLMQDHRFVIVTNPIYQETLKQRNS